MEMQNSIDSNDNGTTKSVFMQFPVVSLHFYFKMVTIDCLGHGEFNWEVSLFFSCSG